MKYIYFAVADGYQYHEVTNHKYKNFVDFIIVQWGIEELSEQLKKYLDKDININNIEWQDFFDDYYGYTTYYIAIDENNKELDDLEDNNITFREFINTHCKQKY